MEVQSKKYFIAYWYGETTSYTNITFYLFSVSDSIELEYSDLVYYMDKQEERIKEANSFDITVVDDRINIRKIKNDYSDATRLSGNSLRIAEDSKVEIERITIK